MALCCEGGEERGPFGEEWWGVWAFGGGVGCVGVLWWGGGSVGHRSVQCYCKGGCYKGDWRKGWVLSMCSGRGDVWIVVPMGVLD